MSKNDYGNRYPGSGGATNRPLGMSSGPSGFPTDSSGEIIGNDGADDRAGHATYQVTEVHKPGLIGRLFGEQETSTTKYVKRGQ